MNQICKFDPQRDIRATVPDMAVDLAAAIENGVVVDTGTVGEYNDIENPASIWRRVYDAFDVVEAQRSVLAKGRIVADGNTPSPTPSTSDGKTE